MPVVLAMMGRVTAISGATGLMGVQAGTCASNMLTGLLSKIPGQPSDYTEAILKSFLTLADVVPTGYHAARWQLMCKKVTRLSLSGMEL